MYLCMRIFMFMYSICMRILKLTSNTFKGIRPDERHTHTHTHTHARMHACTTKMSHAYLAKNTYTHTKAVIMHTYLAKSAHTPCITHIDRGSLLPEIRHAPSQFGHS